MTAVPVSFFVRRAGLMLALSLGGVGAALAGGAHAVVTMPDDVRVETRVAHALVDWQRHGDVSRVGWIRTSDPSAPGVGAFAVVDFPSEAAHARWRRRSANGFDARVDVRRADVVAHAGEAPSAPASGATLKAEVFPQAARDMTRADSLGTKIERTLEAERAAGSLRGYALYLERSEGDHGRALLVLAYDGAETGTDMHAVTHVQENREASAGAASAQALGARP